MKYISAEKDCQTISIDKFKLSENMKVKIWESYAIKNKKNNMNNWSLIKSILVSSHNSMSKFIISYILYNSRTFLQSIHKLDMKSKISTKGILIVILILNFMETKSYWWVIPIPAANVIQIQIIMLFYFLSSQVLFLIIVSINLFLIIIKIQGISVPIVLKLTNQKRNKLS